MVDLTQQQISFLNKFIGLNLSSDGEDAAPDRAALKAAAIRVKAVVESKPQAKMILEGLLREAAQALDAGDAGESERQMSMLSERLDTWEGMDALPDLKSIIDDGLLGKSQQLTPEQSEAVSAAYETTKADLEIFPESVRGAAATFMADLDRLKQRGEQLVGLIEAGDLGPSQRAAHHNEIDQICIRIEGMTADLKSLFEKENVL